MKTREPFKLKAKQLYIAGKSITEIATILNISTRSVQNYKSQDKLDWDILRLETGSSPEKIEIKEKEFLVMLIDGFEKIFTDIKTMPVDTISEAEKRLNLLEKYTKGYWSVKTPNRKDDKQNKISVILDSIKIISDIAIREKNEAVIRFLTSNTDIIIERLNK